MRRFSFVFAILSFFAVSACYGQGDSCLKLLGPTFADDTTWSNPDSVMVDSCINSPTYGQKYARGWFHLRFTYYILPTPVGPEDTIIDRTWQDIDTQYVNVRKAFDTLEQRFGNFILRKFQPHWNDTTNGGDKLFNVLFDNYVNIDSIEIAIRDIPLIQYCDYVNRAGVVVVSVKPLIESNAKSIERVLVYRSRLFDHITVFESFLAMSANKNRVEVHSLTGQSVLQFKKDILSPTDFLQKFSTLPIGTYFVSSSNTVLMVVLTD